jgi:hypothetical protein
MEAKNNNSGSEDWINDPDIINFLERMDVPGSRPEEDDKINTVGGLTNDKSGSFMKFQNKMNKMGKQLSLFPEEADHVWVNDYVPFVSEVETFNKTFGKPNNYEPTIPEEKEWKFVYNFILEELEEYREACERGDIVEVLDALCDITYVSLGNGTMLHGLKSKIWPAYQEVQASNMSKACKTEEEAIQSVSQRSKEQGEACHFEKLEEGRYIVYRTRDRKVMKSINYFRPNLKQFFND